MLLCRFSQPSLRTGRERRALQVRKKYFFPTRCLIKKSKRGAIREKLTVGTYKPICPAKTRRPLWLCGSKILRLSFQMRLATPGTTFIDLSETLNDPH